MWDQKFWAMSGKSVNRKLQRRARILALQALYAKEQQIRTGYSGFCDEFSWLDREASAEELFLARTLVDGVCDNRAELDADIGERLQNWSLDRLWAVDRSILRLGVYMLKYLLDTPERVIIDECIKLCHNFSSEPSYRLINGVLDALAKQYRIGPVAQLPSDRQI